MTNTTQTESDETTGATRRIKIQSMRDLIYPRPAKRFPLPTRLIFVAALLASSLGCATGRPPAADAPETVGQLSASYASIATAPIHHDAPPELGGVAGTDDDAPTTTSLDVLRAEAASAGAVDVAAKDQGLKAGEAR